jgi:Kef-type K+ transport system membrane component KefB
VRRVALIAICWCFGLALAVQLAFANDAGVDGPIRDASVDRPDAGTSDAARRRKRYRDAAIDAPVDAAIDAPVDAPPDAAPDAAVEAIPDAMSAAALEAEAQERAVDAPVIEAQPEGAPASKASTVFTLEIIFGLALLLALAYIGGHPRVLRLQDSLGIRGAISAGFPFVALGVIASHPDVGILSADMLPKLRPVLQFGLGWIGFIIGAQLDIRVLDRVPTGSAYLILIEALLPFAIVAAACGAVMTFGFGLPIDDLAVWRDIVLLGTAAAMTAPRMFRGFANPTWHEGRSADALLGQLDEIVGVVGLLFMMAYFRDDSASVVQLPATWWLFITLGIGVVVGVLVFALIRVPNTSAEFLAVVLGVVAFASGLSGVLRLSPIVVCFVAGVLVTNFPNDQRASVFKILNHLERPLHLLFLMVAGAVWSVTDWRGWALVPLFIAARTAGKWLGIYAARRVVGDALPAAFTQNRALIVPMSTLSIALVVSIERFRDPGLSWVVTAVIGGALATELIVGRRPEPTTVDEPGGGQ